MIIDCSTSIECPFKIRVFSIKKAYEREYGILEPDDLNNDIIVTSSTLCDLCEYHKSHNYHNGRDTVNCRADLQDKAKLILKEIT